jgi:hypothetical protein
MINKILRLGIIQGRFLFFAFKIFTNFYLFITEKSGGRLVPNMEVLRKHLLREGPIEKEHLCELIKELTGIMSK